jgi:hypothetical protein
VSAFFFYNFAAGMSWWNRRRRLALPGDGTVAYLSYDVVMLDPEEVTAINRPAI